MDKGLNQKFNILMALGMIAVVGMHTGFIFVDWVGNGFHIPLFVFVSGYFFSAKPFGTFLQRKVVKLVIPYLLWSALYGCLMTALAERGLSDFAYEELSGWSLLWLPFTQGSQFALNGAAWFVGMLVPIQIIYWIAHRTLRHWLPVGLLFAGLHVLALWAAFHGYTATSFEGPFPNTAQGAARVGYCAVFYYLGHMYRLYGERYDRFRFPACALVLMGFGVLIALGVPTKTFDVWGMRVPNPGNYWQPAVLTLGGIYLCLQAAECLKEHIRAGSLLSYIGRHSWDIMMHQLLFLWLTNTALLHLMREGMIALPSFDMDGYMHNIYYRVAEMPPANELLYFTAALMGPIVTIWVYERFFKSRARKVRGYLFGNKGI